MVEDTTSRINQLKKDATLFKPIVITFLAIVAVSTVFFHFVEKWRWLDSFYFTIVTMSTVGYGNIVPVTDVGKVGNIVLIILGIGIFTALATQVVKRYGIRRLEKEKSRRKE